MDSPEFELTPSPLPAKRVNLPYRARWWAFVLLATYLIAAYIVAPFGWREIEVRHPALTGLPKLTQTRDDIPGDPLNIALIGNEETVTRAMLKSAWHPADPLTMKSCLRIAEDTVLRHPYVDAPVSNLYVWGRKQDLAFEQPVGHDPRQRHHVRFWRSKELDTQGRPLWIGAATYDVKVGFSHTTGQITHHISPDVDRERGKILDDLKQSGSLVSITWIEGFQDHLEGHNGGGDRYQTDGRLPQVLLTISN